MRVNRTKIIILVLVICLVLAVGYIAIDKYNKKKYQEQLNVFQQGAQYGYEQAVVQIVQMAVSCQEVPLNVQNQTINMIAVDCL